MFDKVIKNGKVFLSDRFHALDLGISSDKIAAIGVNLKGKEEIDVSGNWVLPGAIDAHTHFSLPFAGAISADDFFTGTRAGAIGGVTTIIDFTAQKGTEGVLASFERRMQQAENDAATDFSFHACIGKFSDEVADQMESLLEKGLSSLKIFMAYGKVGLMQDDNSIRKIMRACAKNGIMLTVHAENGALIDSLTDVAAAENLLGIEALPKTRPVITEVEAIQRLALLARENNCPTYVVHTSSGEGAQEIARQKINGSPIIAETCPQYLYLDDSKLISPAGHYFACCPPIRDKKQQASIWEGINKGHIAVIATDHCPFKRADKDSWQNSILKLPMGLPGIETLPAMVFNGVINKNISIVAAVKAITENPARLFGLYPEKGSLIPGTDADIMVFDPDKIWKIQAGELNMATDYSPYEGMEIQGKNVLTILRGEVIFSQAQGWQGTKGGGRFLKRKKADPAFFKP